MALPLDFPVTDVHRYLGWRLKDLGMPQSQITATVIACQSTDASGCLAWWLKDNKSASLEDAIKAADIAAKMFPPER